MKYMSTGQSTGTLRWQAPELFPDMLHPDAASAERRNTMATDVYAFALVCYEASHILCSASESGTKPNLTLDVLRRISVP